jgi:hypothetical protein
MKQSDLGKSLDPILDGEKKQVVLPLNNSKSMGFTLPLLWIRIRDPVLFLPLDPGFGIGLFRIPDPKPKKPKKTCFTPLFCCCFWIRDPGTVNSVADSGSLSRILIFTHPGSRIQNQQQKRWVKQVFLSYSTTFCSHNFTKFKIILFLK